MTIEGLFLFTVIIIGIFILGFVTLRTIRVRGSFSSKLPIRKAIETLILVQIAGTIVVTVSRVLYLGFRYDLRDFTGYILGALSRDMFPLLALTGVVIGWISKRCDIRIGVILGWLTAVTYILAWPLQIFRVSGIVDIFLLLLFGIGVPLLGLKTLKAIRAIDLLPE